MPDRAVDRDSLRALLEEVGRRLARPAELFLAGSAAVVMAGVRASIDVDIAAAPDGEDAATMAVVRTVAREMGLVVEVASPADFIPLPDGWRDRCPSIGRFGPLDVFQFDPYSVALSKLVRGHEQDLEDVAALVVFGKVHFERLRTFAAELPSRYAAGSWAFRRGEDAHSLQQRLEVTLAEVAKAVARHAARDSNFGAW